MIAALTAKPGTAGPPSVTGGPTAAGAATTESVVGLTAVAPDAGFPGALPWPALALGAAGDSARLLPAAELDQALADLKGNDPFKAKDAADKLAGAFPPEERRKATANALRPLIYAGKTTDLRGAAARALGRWGTADDEPALATLLNDPSPDVKAGALDGLAALKDERGAEAVAEQLTSLSDREGARKALETMGPVAEKAVVQKLKNPDADVRIEACHILEGIGTKGCLAALRQAKQDPDQGVSAAAAQAEKTVSERTEENPP
jgi:HEAT repeat protein